MSKSEVQPKEIWILKTPGCEFIEHDEPMNYDWSSCRKTKFVEYSAYQAVQKENEELKARVGKLRETINSLETLQYTTPNMREAAYNKAVLDCTNRMLRALKEDGNDSL